MNNKVSTIYSTGRIRSLESHLLTDDRLLRLINAENYMSAIALLRETPYVLHLNKLGPNISIDNLINSELMIIKNLLDHLAPNHPIIIKLWEKYDYLNIKFILKSYLLNKTADKEHLYQIGNLDPDHLIYFIRENTDNIPKNIKNIISQAKQSALENNHNTQIVDIVLDKYYLESAKSLAIKSSVKLFIDYIALQIDLANIKTILTAPNSRIPEGRLVSGGLINTDVLQKPLSEIVNNLKYSPYPISLPGYLQEFEKNNICYKIESDFDNLILDQIRKAKYINFGIEPIIGFFIAKETEIKNLRIILLGKLKNIGPNIIKERLRKSYV
ncbi:MAG: V-type ATPase subunit [bacterium]